MVVGRGSETSGDDWYSFGYVEFAMPTEFKDAPSKQVDLGMELKTDKICDPLA